MICLLDGANREDINTWTITATNTAGSQRLADGSRIMGAKLRGRDATFMFGRIVPHLLCVLLEFLLYLLLHKLELTVDLMGMNAAIEVDGYSVLDV